MTDKEASITGYSAYSQAGAAVNELKTTIFDRRKLSIIGRDSPRGIGGRLSHRQREAERWRTANKESTTNKEISRPIEIAVHLNGKPAAVGKVMVVATAPNVEILASCFYWGRNGAVVRLVTADPQKTAQALTSAGFQCQTDSVLLIGLQKKPGVAAQTGVQLAVAGIDMLYSYVSWSERNQAFAVFKTADDDRALRVLQVNALVEDLTREQTCRIPSEREIRQRVASRLVA